MALIFADGFDHYGNKRPAQKWGVGYVAANITGIIASTAAPVKNGTHSLKMPGGQSLPSMTFSPHKSIVTGFWIYFPALPTNGMELLQVVEFAPPPADPPKNVRHISIRIDPASRRFQIIGEGDAVLATGVTVIAINTWYHIELRSKLNRGSGEYRFRVNMVTEINATSSDTAHSDGTLDGSNNGQWTRVILTGVVPNAYTVIDDFYLSNMEGPAPWNNFMGFARVETLYPQLSTGDVTLRGDMIPYPRGETDHGKQVDEAAPNTTDYNYAPLHLLQLEPGGNHEITDTYNYPDMEPPRTVKINNVDTVEQVVGVQSCPYIQRDQAAVMHAETYIVSSGAKNVGHPHEVEEFWDYYPHMFEADPADGGQWNPTRVNTIRMGLRVFHPDALPVYPPDR